MKKIIWGLLSLLLSTTWAQKSALNLKDDSDFTGFELYKDSLENYSVFINGENHQYTKSNAALQLKMLKYLHQNAGVKTLLLELGWSRGYIITKYIQTGDTTLLPAIKNYSWKYYAEMVESLKAYNDSLPQDQKISVVGIDVERFNNMAIKAMQMQMPKRGSKIPHDSIEMALESLESLDFYLETSSKWDDVKGEYVNEGKKGPNANRTIAFILENITNHKEKYQAYIDPSNQDVFFNVAQQLRDKKKYYEYDYANSVQSYVYREQYMFKEFLKQYEKDTTQKFFMQFGRCHSVKTYQDEACGWYNYYSIANRINEHKSFKNKVLSTAIYYPGSDSWGGFEDSLKKHIEEVYLDSSYKDSLTIWNVMLDTNFKTKHEFIIVNQKALSKDKDPKAVNSWDDDYFEENGEGNLAINFKFGYNNYNYSALNSMLSQRSMNPFQNKLGWGFDFGFFQNKNLYLCFGVNSVLAKKQMNSTGDTLRINPFYMYGDIGWDFLKHEKIDLIPYLGFGNETIAITEKSGTNTGVFGGTITSKASSSTFNMRAGAKIQTNLNGFVLGLDFNLASNIGKTNWTEGQTSINNGPKLKTYGLSSNGYIGFLF